MTDALSQLRSKIDAVDAELVRVLIQRQKLVEQVLAIKKREGLPGRIPDRVETVIQNAMSLGESGGLNPDLARTVWTAMVEWFIAHEEGELAKKP